jgi:hypothetical protein
MSEQGKPKPRRVAERLIAEWQAEATGWPHRVHRTTQNSLRGLCGRSLESLWRQPTNASAADETRRAGPIVH